MQMNSGIILAGNQPDFVNVLARSTQAAGQADAVRQQQKDFGQTNALRQLYQSQGAQIAAGDQNALNALAQYDPQAALGIQHSIAGQGRADKQLGIAERGAGMREQEFDMRVKEYAAGLSAQERAAQAEKIKTGVFSASAAQSPEQWDQIVTQMGQPDLAGQFQNKDALLRQYMTAAQILEADKGPKPADEYERYVQEQAASGQQPLSRIDYAQAKRGKGTVVYDPVSGRPLVSIGGSSKDPTDVSNPSSPAAMVATIDGILNDPALDTATGMLAFMQNVPGTGQKRFGTRSSQLEGQAFLQAFESLKGAGQITEIEGAKATQAIGRLDTSQSPDDYRQALIELKDVLSKAAQRPVGWAEQQSAAPAEIPNITDETGYNALPSGTVFIAPDGSQRRKP